jgi:hypothetical protein
MVWNTYAKRTDTGEIVFHYTQLGDLKGSIQPEQIPQLQLSDKTRMISFTKEYDTDIITLFHATGDFTYRHRWQEGVKAVEEVNHFLPRVGMRCKCVLENGQVSIYSSSYSYTAERIEFSETDETENGVTYYTLEKKRALRTKFSLDIYASKNLISQWKFKLGKRRKLEESFNKSLQNLAVLVREIQLPVAELQE